MAGWAGGRVRGLVWSCSLSALRTESKAFVGLRHRFRPTYAGANVGHPSISLECGYDTESLWTRFGAGARAQVCSSPFTARLKVVP